MCVCHAATFINIKNARIDFVLLISKIITQILTFYVLIIWTVMYTSEHLKYFWNLIFSFSYKGEIWLSCS